ncbi:TPA: hypothetical protein ACF3XP_004537 [Vibrio parahaemolyticus]
MSIISRVGLFFGAASLRFIKPNVFAEILLGEFAVAKASLLAEMTFSQVWEVHVVSVTLLAVRIVRLVFQKRFAVLLVLFLRRCLFHVVSVISRFETAPDFNAAKHIIFVVCKV